MIACTSPAGTCSDTPFRIGLSATVAWRFSIVSIFALLHDEFVRWLSDRLTVDGRAYLVGNDHRRMHWDCAVTWDMRVWEHVLALVSEWLVRHPTLPSRLIPSSFCAS